MSKRVLIFTGLALSLLVPPAASYAQPGATLYELSERVTLEPENDVIIRRATSPLLGSATIGTPLCPTFLLATFSRLERCTVIATGTNRVSTVTGEGPVTGDFDIVVNAPGSSSVHVPSLAVLSGTFRGTINLSLAILSGVPLGSLDNGSLTYEKVLDNGVLVPFPGCDLQCPSFQFTGTFRLPFGLDALGIVGGIDDDDEAFYLADDLTTLIRVRDRERSVGFPPVRLEVRFGP